MYVSRILYNYLEYFTEAIIELIKVNAFLILQITLDSKI